jgi:Fur family ferric uptake transcriptional regulator
MPTSSIDREVEQRLRSHDVRYTRGRRSVVGALAVADGPKSAAELHELIGSAVPLSSLYRSLTVLEDAGVVVPHFGSKGLTRYELAEWIAGHHHHLICLECGAVEDIDVPSQIEDQVRAAVAEIGDRARFVPSGHILEIEGRCARCR